jgi:hypothetical protein
MKAYMNWQSKTDYILEQGPKKLVTTSQNGGEQCFFLCFKFVARMARGCEKAKLLWLFAKKNQCNVGGYIATIKMEIRQSILKL